MKKDIGAMAGKPVFHPQAQAALACFIALAAWRSSQRDADVMLRRAREKIVRLV